MKLRVRDLIYPSLIAGCLVVTACTAPPSASNNQGNGNANAPKPAASQTNSSPKALPKPDLTTGSIEITSVPPGAHVLLVSTEGGAGEPQSKGSTPTTLTGLQPGKYTVDLEKPGYRFFQKEIVVKERTATKVTASLKKQ